MKNKLLIIGNGIAGISLALKLQQLSDLYDITIVSGESEYHYSRPALMYLFMGHMRFVDTMPYPKSFWRRQGITLRQAWVSSIDVSKKKVHLDDSSSLGYDKLVIATGSLANRFGWPGQDLKGVQGFYSLQDIELLEKNVVGAKRAVIVGGGLIGIELAEMLHQRGIHVTFLVRESSYWNNVLPHEESEMINRVIKQEGLDLILSTNLKEVINDGNGRVAGVKTEFDDVIECQLVGLTPGVRPNVGLATEAAIGTNRGILVDRCFQTSVEDVYSIGDCAEIQWAEDDLRVEQLWYTGKAQGECLARNLSGARELYEKGLFYNSAKFFDLEYQVYGEVFPQREGDKHLYWEASGGRQSVRLVFKDERLIGVNVMGIRYRQNVCHQWIREGLGVEEVLRRLGDGNFDAEFYPRYEPEIKRTFEAIMR